MLSLHITSLISAATWVRWHVDADDGGWLDYIPNTKLCLQLLICRDQCRGRHQRGGKLPAGSRGWSTVLPARNREVGNYTLAKQFQNSAPGCTNIASLQSDNNWKLAARPPDHRHVCESVTILEHPWSSNERNSGSKSSTPSIEGNYNCNFLSWTILCS